MPQHYVRFQVDVPVNTQAEAEDYPMLRSQAMELLQTDQQINWIVDADGEPVDAVSANDRG